MKYLENFIIDNWKFYEVSISFYERKWGIMKYDFRYIYYEINQHYPAKLKKIIFNDERHLKLKHFVLVKN